MSSVYSSRGTSRRRSRISSPSSFTPPEYYYDGYDRPQKSVDLDAVYGKLERYQSELDQVEYDMSRQRSFSSREAEEVAAATRFKLDLERLEQFDFEDEEEERLSLPRPLNVTLPPPRTSSMVTGTGAKKSPEPQQGFFQEPSGPSSSKRRTHHRPGPIVVPGVEVMPQEVQSASLLPTSSRRIVQESGPQASLKIHRRHVTISEGRGSARNIVLMSSPSFSGTHTEHELPPLPAFPDFILPVLSPSSSVTTAKFEYSPATPLSLCPPNEDQIRREIELFTLRDGGNSLVANQYKQLPPPELLLDSDAEDGGQQNFREVLKAPRRLRDEETRSFKSTKSTKSISSVMSFSQSRKSIFALFQRKSEVDKLLDLYLTDEPDEKPVKRKQSLARRMTRSGRNANREKPPDVPPLPPMPPLGSFRPG